MNYNSERTRTIFNCMLALETKDEVEKYLLSLSIKDLIAIEHFIKKVLKENEGTIYYLNSIQ